MITIRNKEGLIKALREYNVYYGLETKLLRGEE